jgi:hypothetical protein
VIAALNLVALGLGLGAGGLTATLVSLVVGAGLAVIGLETGPDIGLIAGVVTGLGVGGWVAGRFAVHSERFHGSVTGLLLAGLVLVVARLGGSPAPLASVLWLALLAAVLGGLGGWVAGRRKTRRIH